MMGNTDVWWYVGVSTLEFPLIFSYILKADKVRMYICLFYY